MDTKSIGARIVQARKQKSMSQAQLAGLLFISPQAVGKWERGESVPDIITVNRLAELLEVDLNYFSESFTDREPVGKTMAEDTGEHIVAVPEPEITASSPERPLLTNFSGSNLTGTDFAGVVAHQRRFNGSALRGADFSGADLTGSSFSGSDLRGARFDGANLKDCVFSANDLTDASFNKTILAGTEFSASALTGARFSGAVFTGARLTKTDLRKTIFERCSFTGVDFSHSDLSGVFLDGNTFTDVQFQKAALTEATFNGATLRNVSFRPKYALTNKYFKSIPTIRFAGASMDKLTYAALKGMGAELAGVTII